MLMRSIRRRQGKYPAKGADGVDEVVPALREGASILRIHVLLHLRYGRELKATTTRTNAAYNRLARRVRKGVEGDIKRFDRHVRAQHSIHRARRVSLLNMSQDELSDFKRILCFLHHDLFYRFRRVCIIRMFRVDDEGHRFARLEADLQTFNIIAQLAQIQALLGCVGNVATSTKRSSRSQVAALATMDFHNENTASRSDRGEFEAITGFNDGIECSITTY